VPRLAARRAGPASLVAWAALALASFPIALMFAEMSARRPDCAGIAALIRGGLGATAGDTATVSLVVAYVLTDSVLGIPAAPPLRPARADVGAAGAIHNITGISCPNVPSAAPSEDHQPARIQLRPAPLDLAVNSRLDQHKRAAVLSDLDDFRAASVESLPHSADRAEQERVAPRAPMHAPLPARSGSGRGGHGQLRFEIALQLDHSADRAGRPVEEDRALAAAVAIRRPHDPTAGRYGALPRHRAL
jgi:hypothetical protein